VFGGTASGRPAPDYPWAWSPQEWQPWLDRIEEAWGSPEFVDELVAWLTPSLLHDERYKETIGHLLRLAVSPGDAQRYERIVADTDVRDVLSSVQAPTLLIHRTDDQVEPIEQARYIAERVAGARLLELGGRDHLWPIDDIVPHIGDFLRSLVDREAEFDRVLATVLFTDIVDSTRVAAGLGDRAWSDLVESHHARVRAMLGRYRGTEVDTAGDGFFATFDGPVRALRCAEAIVDAVRPLGVEVRTGVHTGEVATIDGKIGGLGVVIGARVGALAGPSEVLVSRTVKDLVAGSGLVFEDAGEHELKGVPDRWRLFRVMA